METSPPVLGRFKKHLGRRAYATNAFEDGLRLFGRKTALDFDYVSLNQRLRRYIVLDIDYEGGALAWEDIGLEPTLTVINRENAHAHLMYELSSPVSFSGNAREAPQRYFLAIAAGMARRMGADPAYSGLVTKNPLSSRWQTTYTDARYELGQISEYCEPVHPHKDSNQHQAAGRNVSLFNEVRLWAYSRVRGFVIQEAWQSAVRERCEQVNAYFEAPLPVSEVRATARSIAKWTWKNRYNLGATKNRGAAEVDASLPLKEKQRLGAEYSNRSRTEKTEIKISEAAERLQQSGLKLGATVIAKEAGVSRRTAHNYSGLWKR